MDATKEWPQILGLPTGSTITEEVISQQYRKQAKKFHPDAGGSVDAMQQLNAAKELALKWVARERERQEELRRARIVAEQHLAAAQNAMSAAYQQMASQQAQYANDLSAILGSAAAMYGSQQASSAMADALRAAKETTPPASRSDFMSRMRQAFRFGKNKD